jgi:hypothetical protein
MLTASEEDYILTNAYVPEHLVGLMTNVSCSEPFLIRDCLCCRREDWVILVGYPILSRFRTDALENLIAEIKKRFQPRYLSIVAPSLPQALQHASGERESDYYFTLDIPAPVMKNSIKRNIKKAQQLLRVEYSLRLEEDHEKLMQEMMPRINPPPRVKELLLKMPEYVYQTTQGMVLNAWDDDDNLVAFYVIDLAAKEFANYIFGGYSNRHYVRGASDLLLFELIKISKENNKSYIHLGLGINNGIRKFKEKWGGRPTRPYEMCELLLREQSLLETIMTVVKSRLP